MDRGIFVALSGALMQERRLDVLTDNLANVNTAGFKKQKPMFEDVIPRPYGVRTFTTAGSVVTDMSQGIAENTGRKLDFAIRGDGFFAISTPNGVRYTRDGSFTISPDGTLTTMEGHQVLGEKGPIRLNSPDAAIDPKGNIQSNNVTIDRIKLVSFNNAGTGDLVREGGMFALSGQNVPVMPVSVNTQIEQGAIEVSNVNPVAAMTTMIEATRSYETNTKMIQTLDDMTKRAIEDVGAV